MKKGVVITISLVVIIGIVLAFFLINTQKEQFIYKGVWMPSFGSSTIIPKSYLPENLLPEGYDMSIMEPIFADLDKAEQAGINTFATQMGYWVNEQGELSLFPGEKEFFASFIDEAHARGFKVWLNPEIVYFREVEGASQMRIMPEELIENTDLIENFKDAIVETAKFAEEHDVEIFSPSSEMNVNLDFNKSGRERSKEVIIDVKPKIDAVYNGKICLRGEWPNPDFSAYSCFGPTIGVPKNEDEKNELINKLDYNIRVNKKELMLGEIYEGHDFQDMTPEEMKRAFEMALEAAKGRVNGVFILDTGRIIPLFPESYESAIKEFYEKY